MHGLMIAATMLQAAAVPPAAAQADETGWRIATIVIGALQALLLALFASSLQDRRELHRQADARERYREEQHTALREELATQRAHLGVDGNGLMSRMEEMSRSLARMDAKLQEIAVAVAVATRKPD